MAAGDFSPSVLLDAQAKMLEMWASPNPAQAEFRRPVETARALLRNQTARSMPVQVGSQVLGQRVYWTKSGDTTITHSGTAAPGGLDCSLENGTQLETDAKTYTDNVFIFKNVALTDTDIRQKNIFTIEELVAQTLMHAMNRIRIAFNSRCISFLNSSKQPNLDTLVTSNELGNGNWAVNADLATIEVPSDDTKNEDAIVALQNVLENNDFYGGFFLINGYKNWRLQFDTAAYKANNDDQRSIQSTFGDYELYWDVRAMDQALGGFNTFAVDPNAYLFVNRTYSPSSVPVQVDENKFQYYVEDPELMVMVNGVMQPVRYEVIYQRKCSTRNSDTSIAFDHQWEVKLLGQLNNAPAGVSGQTGIMKVKSV
jgi:hypothetical protein